MRHHLSRLTLLVVAFATFAAPTSQQRYRRMAPEQQPQSTAALEVEAGDLQSLLEQLQGQMSPFARIIQPAASRREQQDGPSQDEQESEPTETPRGTQNTISYEELMHGKLVAGYPMQRLRSERLRQIITDLQFSSEKHHSQLQASIQDVVNRGNIATGGQRRQVNRREQYATASQRRMLEPMQSKDARAAMGTYQSTIRLARDPYQIGEVVVTEPTGVRPEDQLVARPMLVASMPAAAPEAQRQDPREDNEGRVQSPENITAAPESQERRLMVEQNAELSAASPQITKHALSDADISEKAAMMLPSPSNQFVSPVSSETATRQEEATVERPAPFTQRSIAALPKTTEDSPLLLQASVPTERISTHHGVIAAPSKQQDERIVMLPRSAIPSPAIVQGTAFPVPLPMQLSPKFVAEKKSKELGTGAPLFALTERMDLPLKQTPVEADQVLRSKPSEPIVLSSPVTEFKQQLVAPSAVTEQLVASMPEGSRVRSPYEHVLVDSPYRHAGDEKLEAFSALSPPLASALPSFHSQREQNEDVTAPQYITPQDPHEQPSKMTATSPSFQSAEPRAPMFVHSPRVELGQLKWAQSPQLDVQPGQVSTEATIPLYTAPYQAVGSPREQQKIGHAETPRVATLSEFEVPTREFKELSTPRFAEPVHESVEIKSPSQFAPVQQSMVPLEAAELTTSPALKPSTEYESEAHLAATHLREQPSQIVVPFITPLGSTEPAKPMSPRLSSVSGPPRRIELSQSVHPMIQSEIRHLQPIHTASPESHGILPSEMSSSPTGMSEAFVIPNEQARMEFVPSAQSVPVAVHHPESFISTIERTNPPVSAPLESNQAPQNLITHAGDDGLPSLSAPQPQAFLAPETRPGTGLATLPEVPRSLSQEQPTFAVLLDEAQPRTRPTVQREISQSVPYAAPSVQTPMAFDSRQQQHQQLLSSETRGPDPGPVLQSTMEPRPMAIAPMPLMVTKEPVSSIALPIAPSNQQALNQERSSEIPRAQQPLPGSLDPKTAATPRPGAKYIYPVKTGKHLNAAGNTTHNATHNATRNATKPGKGKKNVTKKLTVKPKPIEVEAEASTGVGRVHLSTAALAVVVGLSGTWSVC